MRYEFLQHAFPETSVKICGLMDEDMVDVAVAAGAHAIGFVFVEESPRYISIEEAKRLMFQLPEDVLGVAVLQDFPDLDTFSNWDGWLQLCGNEDQRVVASAPCPVIKAMQWNPTEILEWDGCDNLKGILVDGSSGGLGQTFDVTALAKLIPVLKTPIIVAGGLTPENVVNVIEIAKPAAVDVSSGVESTRGIKDPEKICTFLEHVTGYS
jgi:phosphoribosylanthranilate isomerase